MKRLTEKQQAIKEFIEQELKERGRAPSFREIAKTFSIRSLSTVYFHIKALEKKGIISSSKHQPRSFSIQENEEREHVKLKLLGSLSAFRPPTPKEKEEWVSVPEELLTREKKSWLWRVDDSSFLEEGLLKGDLLIVEELENFEEGITLLAEVSGTTLIKKAYEEENRLLLYSQSEQLSPLILPRGSVKIYGQLKATLRIY